MERSEPALVPEWLKNSGTVTGGGRASQPFGSQNLYPGKLVYLTYRIIHLMFGCS